MAFVEIFSLDIVYLFLLLFVQGYGFDEIEYAISNSDDTNKSSFTWHRLSKRASRWDFPAKQNTAIRGFSFDEQVNITRKHNELRKKPYASNMKRMVWDEELREMAQIWADNCEFSHSSNSHRSTPAIPYAGENLFVGTVSYNEEWVIQNWYDEVVYYNYNTLQCEPGEMCGHYTQIVWGDTYKVGCGIRHCDLARTINWQNAYLVVCNYAPGGNYRGMKPYTLGSSCSDCSGNHTVCSDDLCSNSTCFNKQCQNGGSLLPDVCMCDCKPDFSGLTCSTERIHLKRTIHLLVFSLAVTAVTASTFPLGQIYL